MNSPYVIEETKDFAVVFKPPRMHCEDGGKRIAANESLREITLKQWYIENSNKKDGIELMHRLDYDTHGLVLFARNRESRIFFKSAQDDGEFIKEYSAVCGCGLHDAALAGFPAAPDIKPPFFSERKPFVIESYFRPFGKGRKQVRPVTEDSRKRGETAKDRCGYYKTEIININGKIITARIKRGFRHQIRCHLCWIGFPIKNDPLYSANDDHGGEKERRDALSLRAHAVFFPDPSFSPLKSGKKLEFYISPLQ
jgi:23S rRNA pseudouridine1911/1915/1917 synthase